MTKDNSKHVHSIRVDIDRARALLKTNEDEFKVGEKKVVGGFGIIDHTGYPVKMFWVVNPRKDMRHGVVDKQGHLGEYQESLFDKMFRKW